MKLDELPVSWFGLTAEQTLAVLPFVWAMPRNATARVGVVRALLDKNIVRKMTPDDIYDITNPKGDLGFLWEDEIDGQPFKYFMATDLKRYYLPVPGFIEITLQEFLNANTYFLQFSDTIQESSQPTTQYPRLTTQDSTLTLSATKLIAHICRPANKVPNTSPLWNGDNREPYNEHVAEARAKDLKIDLITAMSIVRYWGQELRAFYDRYDILEDNQEPEPTEGQDTEPTEKPTWIELAVAWKQTHFDLAQDRSLGDFKTIATMTMPDIGLYLAKLKQQQKEREAMERKNVVSSESF